MRYEGSLIGRIRRTTGGMGVERATRGGFNLIVHAAKALSAFALVIPSTNWSVQASQQNVAP